MAAADDNDSGRCWPGYEPVPGKTQHEEGSCRKKAESKSTSTDKKAQATRKKELDTWQKEHPGKRRSAAQHLHSSLETAPKTAAAKKKKTTAAAKKKKSSSTTTTATKKRAASATATKKRAKPAARRAS